MKKAVIMLLVVVLLAGVFGLPPVRAAEGIISRTFHLKRRVL
jgi:hypothetical protein